MRSLCSVSWWDLTLSEGRVGWLSGGGASVSGSLAVAETVSWMCLIARSVLFSRGGFIVVCASMFCWSRVDRDLLMVESLFRMCCRGVTSGGLSRRYMYRFLAIVESWTYILGQDGGRVSWPMMSARSSAVLIVVGAVPMCRGRYVLRARSGCIR